MEDDLLEALGDRAIAAYFDDEQSDNVHLMRPLGAILGFHGLAENGGLVGGAVENIRLGDEDTLLDDAVAAFRLFGLDTHAELIERADREYARFRPMGFEDLSNADEALWEELDTAYFATVTDDSIEAALRRFPGLRP
ncbi:hypothetical protein ACIPUB_04390 [Paeniglutamicibacter sp. ORCA_105]|uniref:DMP19 family protein n=1 Tax=Paeniglutamicibacter sp. ORCA_105 TaxID=3377336 RepID=UPI003894D56F